MNELKAKDYVGQPIDIRQGQEFKRWPRIGWKSIDVLEFLKGKPWDDVALGYVHALRPSHIRVTTGMVQLDAQVWRVTVFVTEEGIIKGISQEAEVGLPDEVPHGHGLAVALKHGLNSPQMKWEQLDGDVHIDGIHGKAYKITPDGQTIPHPNN